MSKKNKSVPLFVNGEQVTPGKKVKASLKDLKKLDELHQAALAERHKKAAE